MRRTDRHTDILTQKKQEGTQTDAETALQASKQVSTDRQIDKFRYRQTDKFRWRLAVTDRHIDGKRQ